MAHNRKDMLWKSIVQEFDKDLVRFFYKDADNIFDLEGEISFLDTELRQTDPHADHLHDSKSMDGLLQIPLKHHPKEYLLLMLEVQGYNRYEYPQYIYNNFSRLLDKYPYNISVKVIYTETSKGFNPNTYNYHSLGTKLSFEYETYVVWNQHEAELEADTNPIALVILTVLLFLKVGKNDLNKLFQAKVRLLQILKSRDLNPEQEYKLLAFIICYVPFKDKEMNDKFNHQIILTGLKTITMTLLDIYAEHKAHFARLHGIEEGRVKAAEIMIRNGLELRLVHKFSKLKMRFLKKLYIKLHKENIIVVLDDSDLLTLRTLQ